MTWYFPKISRRLTVHECEGLKKEKKEKKKSPHCCFFRTQKQPGATTATVTFGSASGGMKSPVSRGRFTHPALVKLRVKRYDVVPPRCFKEHWCQERDKKPQVCDATGRGLGVKSALWRRVHDRSGLKKKKHITRASAFTIAKTTEKKNKQTKVPTSSTSTRDMLVSRYHGNTRARWQNRLTRG